MLEEFEKKLLKILDDEKFQETRNVLLDLVKQEGMKNIFIEDVKLQRKITLSNNIAQIYRASGKITKDDFFIKNIRIGFEKANNAELEELKNSSNEVADLILKQSEEIFYALRILDF
jgi:phage-related tail protein